MAVINKCWPIRRGVVVVIILLYALIAVNFAVNWSYMRFAFVEDGQNFWAVSSDLDSATQTIYWETGISASVSTSLADLYMVCVIPLGIIYISSPLFCF